MAPLTPVAGQQRDQRRKVLMGNPRLTGLDSVAVDGRPAPLPDGGGELWRLRLTFVPAAPGTMKRSVPEGVTAERVRILLNGTPDPYVTVRDVRPDRNGTLAAVVEVRRQDATEDLDPPVHILRLVDVPDLDPLFASAPVAFQLGQAGGSEARMVPRGVRAEESPERTDIDYLAKDFESFRQLLLERMAFYIPSWEERNPSDIGVTVIEVLAYAADYLSYYQDAVATEAYLETARRRISVRRHTRMLDFHAEEGMNARVWVHLRLDRTDGGKGEAELRIEEGTPLLTAAPRLPPCIALGSDDHRRALEAGCLVFHSLYPVTLSPEHNELEIYTWGAEDFTLPQGASRATLRGHFPKLQAGDVLVFEKRIGSDEDNSTTDPRHRRAVRLSRAPVLTEDPLTDPPTPVTEIAWFERDALPAEFPVSRTAGRIHQERLSTVWGNILLADHGEVVEELLEGPVPAQGRYEPILPRRGLTFRQPFDAAVARQVPAAQAVEQVSWLTLPTIELSEIPAHMHLPVGSLAEARQAVRPWFPVWRPRADLLNSGRFARDFVVEVDELGEAHLRFGDGQAGRRPPAGSRFLARYRIGMGPRGNVGPHSVRHVVLDVERLWELEVRGLTLSAVANHLPGVGGSHARPTEHARVYAPDVIHTPTYQRRCVTDGDYVAVASRHPEVLRAAVRRQWSGDSSLVILFVQRKGGHPVDDAFAKRLHAYLQPFLTAGAAVAIRDPLLVPLDIQATVMLRRGVRAEMLYQRLFSQTARDGRQLFDPDDFSFGDPVYLSWVTALLMGVPGVADVRVDVFRRWGQPATDEMEAGRIPIGPYEVARIDNDPDAPQRGTFKVKLEESR